MSQIHQPELVEGSLQEGQRQFFPFFFPRRFFPFFFLSPFFFPFFREDDERNVDFYSHHSCKEGETLDALAEQYNVPKPVMSALNPHVHTTGSLKAGEKVGIPKLHNMFCQTFYREEESQMQSFANTKPGVLNTPPKSTTEMLKAFESNKSPGFANMANMPSAQTLQNFPNFPNQPGVQSFQEFPSLPNQPGMQSFQEFPSLPNQPGMQSFQEFPNLPNQPGMQSFQEFPSLPNQPGMQSFQAFPNSPNQPGMQSFQAFPNSPNQPGVQSFQAFPNSPFAESMNYPGLRSLDAPEFSANFSPMPLAPNEFSNIAASYMTNNPQG